MLGVRCPADFSAACGFSALAATGGAAACGAGASLGGAAVGLLSAVTEAVASVSISYKGAPTSTVSSLWRVCVCNREKHATHAEYAVLQ